MVATGLWWLCLAPNKPSTGSFVAPVLLTNVALTDQLQDPEGRTSVRITVSTDNEYEGTFILCSLTAGKVEQSTVNITLNPGIVYTFEAVGLNTVYLSGNYLAHGTKNHVDQPADRPAEQRAERDALPSGSVDSAGPQRTPDTRIVRKRQRTSRDAGEASIADTAPEQVSKGKAVDRPASKAERIQLIDYDLGHGTQAIKWGDEVFLKYKMVTATNAAAVSDNIQAILQLHFVVGDMTATIPQTMHAALLGMKLRAQRILKVPLEVVQKDASLSVFLKPAQAYRIDMFVFAFNPAQSTSPQA